MGVDDTHRRTRVMFGFVVLLWCAAVAALVVGMRTHVRPVLLVGVVGAVLALVLTQLWLRRGMRRG